MGEGLAKLSCDQELLLGLTNTQESLWEMLMGLYMVPGTKLELATCKASDSICCTISLAFI